MKIRIFKFLLLIFFTSHIPVKSQLKLEIIELTISRIIDNNFSEGYEGPVFRITGELINMSKEDIRYYGYKDSLNIVFFFKGSKYVEKLVMWPQDHKEKYDRMIWLMNQGESFKFISWSNIFLGTKFYKYINKDYTNLLLEILPTMSFEFKPYYYPDWIIYSDRIENVQVNR